MKDFYKLFRLEKLQSYNDENKNYDVNEKFSKGFFLIKEIF